MNAMPYHSYIFFDSDINFALLPVKKQQECKKKFIATVNKKNRFVKVESYATLGLKAGTRFMLYCNAASPDHIQDFIRDCTHTELGIYLRITYTLLGMTRASPYNPKSVPKESSPDVAHRYLIVYPFTKTIEWHLLPYEERRRIMKDHVNVGRKFTASISQLLLYSYGIDDHEFIVSYQTDILEDFQTLVMELRGTEGRRHTKNDLPIFTCIHRPLSKTLDML